MVVCDVDYVIGVCYDIEIVVFIFYVCIVGFIIIREGV